MQVPVPGLPQFLRLRVLGPEERQVLLRRGLHLRAHVSLRRGLRLPWRPEVG